MTSSITDGLAHLDQDKVQATIDKWNDLRETNPTVKTFLSYAHGNLRFALWLHLCDAACFARTQLSIFDLADACWRDKFDAGTRPRDAVQEALEEDDMFTDVDLG